MKPPCRIPIDILLSIADILPLEDLLHLLEAIPYLTPNLPSRLLKSQDPSGNTLLHLLVSSNLYTLTTLLPKQQPKALNTPNYDGQTALHKAALTQNLQITTYLIHHGADIQPRDNREETPLHLTCRTTSPVSSQILNNLLNTGADPSPHNITGFTPLHEAILSHQPPSIIRTLLKAGADVNVTAGRKRWTPLFYAVRFSIESPTEVLISAGADPILFTHANANANANAKDELQKCPAPSPSPGRGIEIVKTVLEGDVDLEQRDIDGRTVLLETARVGADEALALLLDAGADIGVWDGNRRNALCLAASMGHWSTAKRLVEAGAAVMHRDLLGRDAVGLAMWFGFEDLAKMLVVERRKRPFRCLFELVGRGWGGSVA
jgi:ankyrin repeat protein